MARYVASPTPVDAVQFDGTSSSVAAFIGGSATFTATGSGVAFLESNKGRVAVNPTDWLVRLPATTSDQFDSSDDFYISVVPASLFAVTYSPAT